MNSAFFDFFDRLAANMNREWFNAHKDIYRQNVYEPFYELTSRCLQLARAEIDPAIPADPRQAMFRIYRDTRFSADKSPYKLWMGAVVSRGGRKNSRWPELYFQFGHERNFIAGGLYRPDKEILARIRTAIATDPARIDRINNNGRLRRFFPGGLLGERNKRLPTKEWMQIARHQPFILNKQFYTYKEIPRSEILQIDDLARWIVDHFHAMQPWNDFLTELI